VREELLARAWQQQQPRQPQQQFRCTAAAAPVGGMSSVRKGAQLGYELPAVWQLVVYSQCNCCSWS
jgi:hypothetical protein